MPDGPASTSIGSDIVGVSPLETGVGLWVHLLELPGAVPGLVPIQGRLGMVDRVTPAKGRGILFEGLDALARGTALVCACRFFLRGAMMVDEIQEVSV